MASGGGGRTGSRMGGRAAAAEAVGDRYTGSCNRGGGIFTLERAGVVVRREE